MSNHSTSFPLYTGSTFYGKQSEDYKNLLASKQSFQPSSTKSSSTMIPTESTVVIGKGNVPKNAPGNRKLLALIHDKIPEYIATTSKLVKSAIVSDIYFAVEKSCLKEGSSTPFLRYSKAGYQQSSESIAREKITTTFRDILHNKYKSSSKHKIEKRRINNRKKAEKKRGSLLQDQQKELDDFKKVVSEIRKEEERENSLPEKIPSNSQLQQQQEQQQQQREKILMAQQQHIDILKKEMLQLRQADFVLRNELLQIQQATAYQQQLQQQQQVLNQRDNIENNGNCNGFQDLYNKLFTSSQPSSLPRTGTSSTPIIEFDRSFFDVDMEPRPIGEPLDYSSTSSCSSSLSSQSYNSFYGTGRSGHGAAE